MTELRDRQADSWSFHDATELLLAEQKPMLRHCTLRCAHTTNNCTRDAFAKMYIPLQETIPAVCEHMVVNEHAGLFIHTKTQVALSNFKH